MSKIFALDVKEREGDLLHHQLNLNGEPFKFRTEWQYLDHRTFIYHWPSHEGGSTVFVPLNDSELRQDLITTEAFVARYVIIPRPWDRRRSLSPLMIDDGESLLVGWHPKLLPHRQGWFRFSVDLSRVVTGPKARSPHTIRFEPEVDIEFLPL